MFFSLLKQIRAFEYYQLEKMNSFSIEKFVSKIGVRIFKEFKNPY